MKRNTKVINKTKAKVKPIAKPTSAKPKKIKPKFNLKGIPAKYKLICTLAIEHAATQQQCDELVLVGVNAYETLLETYTVEQAEKLKQDAITKAMLLKKETFIITED
jgi:hypothetical protein